MPHYLRGNRSEAAPSAFVVIDTEGSPYGSPQNKGRYIHHLRQVVSSAWRYEGGKTTREDRVTHASHIDWWRWLNKRLDRRRPTWVWGHNIGYDLTSLRVWAEIEDGRLSFGNMTRLTSSGGGGASSPDKWRGILVTSDPPTLIRCRTPSGATVVFCDLQNWCHDSLSEIADSLGLPLRAISGELVSDKDLAAYQWERLAVIRSAVERIVKMARSQCLGQFRSTIASQAHHAWRHPDVPCPIMPSPRRDIRDLERKAYYGGRCHVYFNGSVLPASQDWVKGDKGLDPFLPTIHKGPVYHLDVVGCYASVMCGNLYPVIWRKTKVDISVDSLRDYMGAYAVVASVEIKTQERPYPVRRPDGTLWCVGEFECTLPGPELAIALSRGEVRRVHRADLYTRNNPFDRFVDRMWAMRSMYMLANMPFEGGICKRIMAALHGKLGARSHRWELAPGLVAPQPWGQYAYYDGESGEISVRRAIGGHVQIENPDPDSPSSLCAISAYVTSYARLWIEQLREVAMNRAVLYEDADSLHVTKEGYQRLDKAGLINEHELGHCRVVQVANRACYWGPRDYQLDDRRVKMGRQRAATVTPKGDWEQTDYLHLDSLLAGVPPDGPVAVDRSLQCDHSPLRASAGEDGWTRPLRV